MKRRLTHALVLIAVLLALPAGALARSRHSHQNSARISTSPTQVVGTLTDRQAAALVNPNAVPDRRSDNAADNQRVPSAAQLANFRANEKAMPSYYFDRVTGNYRGTTDEIIQWAAYKWGFSPQLFRAVAAVESWWHMSTNGDGGNAYGLFQVDTRYHANTELAQNYTAFNADYYGAELRSYWDGSESWLNTVSGNGAPYTAHDLWGSIGYWCAGRWHTSAGATYVSAVQNDLSQQVWLGQWF